MKNLKTLLCVLLFVFIQTDISYSKNKVKPERRLSHYYSEHYKERQKPKKVVYKSERPSDCPSLWCGCWLSKFLFGTNHRDLWLAKNWLKFPKTSAHPGAVAVLGRKGGGHVGVVQSIDKNGNPVIKSGNHSNKVAVATYSKSNVIAYVSPSVN